MTIIYLSLRLDIRRISSYDIGQQLKKRTMINEPILSDYSGQEIGPTFFDIKESKDSKRYLSIVENKKKDGEFENFKVMI